MITVRLYHKKTPDFRVAPSVKLAEYELMHQDVVPAGDLLPILEDMYEQTQNIEEAWRPAAPCRSTSIGDIMSVTYRNGSGAWYMVTSIGFGQVEVCC